MGSPKLRKPLPFLFAFLLEPIACLLRRFGRHRAASEQFVLGRVQPPQCIRNKPFVPAAARRCFFSLGQEGSHLLQFVKETINRICVVISRLRTARELSHVHRSAKVECFTCRRQRIINGLDGIARGVTPTNVLEEGHSADVGSVHPQCILRGHLAELQALAAGEGHLLAANERYRSPMFRRRAKSEPARLDPRLGPDTISFDTFDWERQPDEDGDRVWFGDGTIFIILSEHFFALPPDLPGTDVDLLRSSYETWMADIEEGDDGRTGRLVELNVDPNGPVVRVVVRIPVPDRYLFVGSLTIPLAECSWVVKVQAVEGSITGLREALAADRALKEGGLHSFQDLEGVFDPYDRQWDDIAPGDPLTAVRHYLDRLEASLQFDSAFSTQKPFRSS